MKRVEKSGRILPPDYRRFVHGYAATSYAAGQTVDHVLFSDAGVSWCPPRPSTVFVVVGASEAAVRRPNDIPYRIAPLSVFDLLQYMPDFLDPLLEPARLRAIDEILAAHSKGDIEFDRLTRLGAGMLHVPICLVTLVTADRQILQGSSGLPENLDTVR